MQPIVIDESGRKRFKANAIIDYLWGAGAIDMNRLARIPFPQDDREQFYQLIGYSIGGYCELSMVSDESKDAAEAAAFLVEEPTP